MIVRPERMTSRHEWIRVSARIVAGSARAVPEQTLWYEFPEAYREAAAEVMDGFATAALLVAMAHGEPLDVQGPVTSRLLRGLREVRQVFHTWFPARFEAVDIRCREPLAPGASAPPGVASAFSGGVDSSYTVWSHLPANEPDESFRLTHAIFVHGFDIPLADRATYDRAAHAYSLALRDVGVELIPVRTNVRRLGAGLPWEQFHGAALVSVAMMLGRLIGRFYVPASFPYSDLRPWGSHPVSDPLMSTNTLEVHHDGAIPRVEKIRRIAAWAPTRSWLRVCWERPSADRNCCECYNCVLTMIGLDLAGALDQYPTFPKPLSAATIRGLRLPAEEFDETETVVQRAVDAGRADIAAALQTALRRSRRTRRRSLWRRGLKLPRAPRMAGR